MELGEAIKLAEDIYIKDSKKNLIEILADTIKIYEDQISKLKEENEQLKEKKKDINFDEFVEVVEENTQLRERVKELENCLSQFRFAEIGWFSRLTTTPKERIDNAEQLLKRIETK